MKLYGEAICLGYGFERNLLYYIALISNSHICK